jgi:hypothetical protein
MKVRSRLADMDVVVGRVRRAGNDLVLMSGPDSSMEATIIVSAREVVATLMRVLTSPAGLLFVVGLPWFWFRQTLGRGSARGTTASRTARPGDINKPW